MFKIVHKIMVILSQFVLQSIEKAELKKGFVV